MDEDRVVELLEELVKWTKVTSISKVKELLLSILKSPEEVVAYQLSDGKSSGKIAKETNVSYVTITVWWKSWIKAGIAEEISARGGSRAKRVFSLDDFGIDIPKIVKSRAVTKGGKDSDKQNSNVGAS